MIVSFTSKKKTPLKDAIVERNVSIPCIYLDVPIWRMLDVARGLHSPCGDQSSLRRKLSTLTCTNIICTTGLETLATCKPERILELSTSKDSLSSLFAPSLLRPVRVFVQVTWRLPGIRKVLSETGSAQKITVVGTYRDAVYEHNNFRFLLFDILENVCCLMKILWNTRKAG